MVELWLKNKSHEDLLPYMADCLSTEHFVNVEFVCQNGRSFFAHKFYLTKISKFLQTLLWPSRHETASTVIHLPDFDERTVKNFLTFLYSGCTDVIGSIDDFFSLAHELRVSTKDFTIYATESKRNECVESVSCVEAMETQTDVTGEEALEEHQVEIKETKNTSMETKHEATEAVDIDMGQTGGSLKREINGVMKTQEMEKKTEDAVLTQSKSAPVQLEEFCLPPGVDSCTLVFREELSCDKPIAETGDQVQEIVDLEPQASTNQPIPEAPTEHVGVQDQTPEKSATIECYKCEKEVNVENQLLRHLVLKHHKSDFAQMMAVDKNVVCCGKQYWPQSVALILHYGIGHGLIFDLMPEEFREKLLQLRSDIGPTEDSKKTNDFKKRSGIKDPKHPEPKKPSKKVPKDLASSSAVGATEQGGVQMNPPECKDSQMMVSSDFPPCYECGFQTNTKGKLLMHLILEHYPFMLEGINVQENVVCCGKAYNSNKEGNFKYAIHMGIRHNNLYSFMPPEFRLKLLNQKKPVEVKPQSPTEPQTSQTLNNRCPMCDDVKAFVSPEDLLKHLASFHFSEKFMDLYNWGKGACSICHKSFTMEDKVMGYFDMHMGVVHMMFLNLVPQHLKKLTKSLIARVPKRTEYQHQPPEKRNNRKRKNHDEQFAVLEKRSHLTD